MRIPRSWQRHKALREFRRHFNAGETQRQTIYTLLLTFVPFATIVAALSVISNAEVVEALSRHVRKVDSALTEIRHAAGVDNETDVGTLIRQAVWAFDKKADIEIRYVKDANDPAKLEESFGWSVGETVIGIGKESEHLDLLAGLSREERWQALTRNVELYVVKELEHKSVDDLSPNARSESKAISARNLRDRETILYDMFLKRGLTQTSLNQNDIKLLVANASSLNEIDSVEQLEVSKSGDDRIDSWISGWRRRFRDPPEEAQDVETDVAQDYRDEQLLALWHELPSLQTRVNAITIPGPNEPVDFLEKNLPEVIARLSGKIKNLALEPEEQGPLTLLAVNDRAKALIEHARTDMRKELLAAIPNSIDSRTADLVKKELRPNPARAQELLDQYILSRCQAALDSGGGAALIKTDLDAFPRVVSSIERFSSQLKRVLADQLAGEIQTRIEQIDKDQDQLNQILAQIPGGALPQVANLEAKSKYLTADMFPELGLDGVVGTARVTVGGPEGYPLNDKELERLTQILAKHIRRRASELQRATVTKVKGVTEVAMLGNERDLTKYRKGSEALEALTNRVADALLDPDARQYEAAREVARKHATGLIETRREALVACLVTHIEAAIDRQLQETDSAPIDKTERIRLAQQLLANAFPINAPDVVAEQQDLGETITSTLLKDVAHGLDGLAVRRAIQGMALDAKYDPFRQGAEEELPARIAKVIEEKTGAPLREADVAAVQSKALLLHRAARDQQLSAQQQAIDALTDADLPETIIGVPGDEKKAFDAMAKLLLKQLGHQQLGPSSAEALTGKINTFVARRVEYAAGVQVTRIDTFQVADLPPTATSWIVKGDKTKACEESVRSLSKIVCTKTKTLHLVEAAQGRLVAKIRLLVNEKYQSVVDIQLNAVKDLTETDLPDSVIPLIVAANGDESEAGKAALKNLDDRVRGRTDTAEASTVLAEVRQALQERCAELIRQKHAAELQIQCKQVKAKITSYVITPTGGQSFKQFMDVCVESICALAGISEDRRLPGTRKFLEKEIGDAAKRKFDSLMAIQMELRDTIRRAGGIEATDVLKPTDDPISPGVGGGNGYSPEIGIDRDVFRAFEGMTAEQLLSAKKEFKTVADKKEVMAAARQIIRNEIEWKLEWFGSSPSLPPPYALCGGRDSVDKQIVKKLLKRNLQSAEQFEEDIAAELEAEWREIHKWCDKKAKRLLDSPESRRLIDEELAPYVKKEKDLSEWYSDSSDFVDPKKVKAAAEQLLRRLVDPETN